MNNTVKCLVEFPTRYVDTFLVHFNEILEGLRASGFAIVYTGSPQPYGESHVATFEYRKKPNG